ncbi:MAG: hypothetical protein GQ570_14470 [Helicobacteraceae bacterium]|nr:hypothetical protein [Helicobacteraceae bacterium]
MELFVDIFFIIMIFVAFGFYIKHKMSSSFNELHEIQRGYCPKCKESISEEHFKLDKRNGSCGGVSTMIATCGLCGYENAFSVGSSSTCGSGSCKT